MDIQEFHKTLRLFKELGLSELKYEDGQGFRLKLSQQGKQKLISQSSNTPVAEYETVTSSKPATTPVVEDDVGIEIVPSPLVGTLYLRPSPEDEVFVKTGSSVKEGDVLFIVEAMKVMNEVKSPCDGEVIEILETPSTMVDFGRPIIKIRKS